MGYATRDLNAGFTVAAPTFIDVGGDGTIALENLKVVDGIGSMAESIQVLGANGRMTGETYYWLSEAADYMPDGWYDEMWESIEGVTVPKGAGFVFSCMSGAKLQTFGEVVAGETRKPLNVGFTVAGNNTNIDRDLQDFKIEDGIGSMAESIQVLGTNGRMTGATYYWLSEAVDDMPDGWYDEMWEPITGVTLKAGQAHVFSCMMGATLVIPSQLD